MAKLSVFLVFCFVAFHQTLAGVGMYYGRIKKVADDQIQSSIITVEKSIDHGRKTALLSQLQALHTTFNSIDFDGIPIGQKGIFDVIINAGKAINILLPNADKFESRGIEAVFKISIFWVKAIVDYISRQIGALELSKRNFLAAHYVSYFKPRTTASATGENIVPETTELLIQAGRLSLEMAKVESRINRVLRESVYAIDFVS